MANQNPDREEGNEGVSASTQNLAFHAVRFLYEKALGVKLGDLSNIPRATGHARIVDVPPMEEALQIVRAVNGKTGTALRLILGTAGRLNDILRLRVKDLDFRRKLVAIQESKGGKWYAAVPTFKPGEKTPTPAPKPRDEDDSIPF